MEPVRRRTGWLRGSTGLPAPAHQLWTERRFERGRIGPACHTLRAGRVPLGHNHYPHHYNTAFSFLALVCIYLLFYYASSCLAFCSFSSFSSVYIINSYYSSLCISFFNNK